TRRGRPAIEACGADSHTAVTRSNSAALSGFACSQRRKPASSSGVRWAPCKRTIHTEASARGRRRRSWIAGSAAASTLMLFHPIGHRQDRLGGVLLDHAHRQPKLLGDLHEAVALDAV